MNPTTEEKRRGSALIALCVCLGALGCERTTRGIDEDAAQIEREAKESAANVKDDVEAAYERSARELSEFDKATRERLRKIDAKVEQLRAKGDHATADAKEKIEQRLNELERQRAELDQHLVELRKRAKAELKGAMDALTREVDELEKRLDEQTGATP